MNFLKKVKKLIYQLDIFNQPINFRFRQQRAYSSLTGGVISIILIIAFCSIFFTTVLSTINKTEPYSIVTHFRQDNPSRYTVNVNQTFLFAIGITNLNLNQGSRYFDIAFQHRKTSSSQKIRQKLPLQKCTKQQWMEVKQQFGQLYHRLNFQQWLCPTQNITLELQGKFTSNIFQYYRISVSKCNQLTDPTRQCVNQTTIESFLNKSQSFNLNFYFVNTLINVQSKDPIDLYLEDNNYFPFNTKIGVQANLFIEHFQIETDNSVLPWGERQLISGGVITDAAQSSTFNVRSDAYIKLYLRKSSLFITAHRSFTKIFQTLSYIGGLFSFLLLFFYFLGKYNESSFEIEMTETVFYQEKGKPFDYKGFNILCYFMYVIYSFFANFNIEFDWKQTRKYYQAIEEMKNQLDIRLILRKLLLFQRIIAVLFQEHHIEIFSYQQPSTIAQAIKIRNMQHSYKKQRKRQEKILQQMVHHRNDVQPSDVRNDPLQVGDLPEIIQNLSILESKSLMGDKFSKNIFDKIDTNTKKLYYDYRKKQHMKLNPLNLKRTQSIQVIDFDNPNDTESLEKSKNINFADENEIVLS